MTDEKKIGENEYSHINPWKEWGNYVLKTLDKVEKKIDNLECNFNKYKVEINTEIIRLKTKAAVWGSIAGFLFSAIVSFGVLVGGHVVKDEIITKDTTTKQVIKKEVNERLEKKLDENNKE